MCLSVPDPQTVMSVFIPHSGLSTNLSMPRHITKTAVKGIAKTNVTRCPSPTPDSDIIVGLNVINTVPLSFIVESSALSHRLLKDSNLALYAWQPFLRCTLLKQGLSWLHCRAVYISWPVTLLSPASPCCRSARVIEAHRCIWQFFLIKIKISLCSPGWPRTHRTYVALASECWN